MSSFTRQAIMDSFLRLLEKKPFGKITVRDIVEECGVNRTTFYYYYQDIYAIVEDLIASALAAHAAVFDGDVRPADLRDARDFATIHRRALLGLYESLGHEAVRRYIFREMDGPLAAFVEKSAEGLAVSAAQKHTVFLLVRESLFGALCLFLRGDLSSEEAVSLPLVSVHRLVRLALERLVSAEGNAEPTPPKPTPPSPPQRKEMSLYGNSR